MNKPEKIVISICAFLALNEVEYPRPKYNVEPLSTWAELSTAALPSCGFDVITSLTEYAIASLPDAIKSLPTIVTPSISVTFAASAIVFVANNVLIASQFVL